MFASINMIWAQYAKQWKTWLGTWGGSKPICAQWKEEMSTSNCNVAEVFLFRYGCTHSILIPFCQNILMTLLTIHRLKYFWSEGYNRWDNNVYQNFFIEWSNTCLQGNFHQMASNVITCSFYDKGMHKCWLKIDFPSSVCRDVYHMLNLRSIDVHK